MARKKRRSSDQLIRSYVFVRKSNRPLKQKKKKKNNGELINEEVTEELDNLCTHRWLTWWLYEQTGDPSCHIISVDKDAVSIVKERQKGPAKGNGRVDIKTAFILKELHNSHTHLSTEGKSLTGTRHWNKTSEKIIGWPLSSADIETIPEITLKKKIIK